MIGQRDAPHDNLLVVAKHVLPDIPEAPPSSLEADPGACDVWLSLVPMLQDIGHITALNIYSLEQFCIAVSFARRVGKEMSTADPLIDGGQGKKPNPITTVYKNAVENVEKLARSLNITATTLQRINARISDVNDQEEEGEDAEDASAASFLS